VKFIGWESETFAPPFFACENVTGAYKHYDYGYFWWSNPVSQNDKKTNIFLARGAGGQNIIINRDENLVIVTTAWNMQQPNKVQLIYDWYFSK